MNIQRRSKISNFDEMHAAGPDAGAVANRQGAGRRGGPVRFECRYMQTIDMPKSESGNYSSVVFGQVVGIHIDDDVIVDGMVDSRKYGRSDGWVTTTTWRCKEVFSLPRLTRRQLAGARHAANLSRRRLDSRRDRGEGQCQTRSR